MRFLTAIALTLALALQGSTPTATAQPLPPPPVPFGRVVDVRIEGIERQQPAAVRRLIGTHVGDLLDPVQLRQDLLAIRRLQSGASSVFDDVRVETERVGDGIRVIFVVHERPRLEDVVFRFAAGAPLTDEIRGLWPVEPGDLYDLTRVRVAERTVEDRYREAGHAFPFVGSAVEESDDGRPRLVVDVDPGPVVVVRRLVFAGNATLADDQLRDVLLTREIDLPSSLVGRGRFDPTVLDEDRRRLQILYQNHGFADVVVGAAEVEVARDRSAVFVRFAIEEGPRYRVASVSLLGDLVEPADTLRSAYVGVRAGDWLSLAATEVDVARLEAFYREEGYARAEVRRESERQPGEPMMALTYRIERGPPTWIGRITIIGNAVTSDRVIRRQLRMVESARFRLSELLESRARLSQLGPFESVAIREIETDDPEIIDLEVEVVERGVIQPAASVGIGSDGNVIVIGQVATPNFLGRGQLLAARVELGTLRTGVSLAVTDPDVRASGWRVEGRAFWQDITFPDFRREAFGLGLNAGYPLRRDLRLSAGYLLEDVEVSPAPGRQAAADSLGQLFSAGRTSLLSATLEWDRRDSRISPTSGFQQIVTGAWANAAIGSEVDFVRAEGASRWYAPLGPLGLRLNLEIGYVVSTDSARRVPISERYFLGGPSTVRGFEPFTLSPAVPVPDDPGAPGSQTNEFLIGGNKFLLGNLELTFPLVRPLGLEGLVFFDVGNAFGENESYTLRLDVFADSRRERSRLLRTSAGIGLRWTALQGVPLRFEWGFPLAPVEGEEPFIFTVGAGLAF